ncbi:hypothetical protein [Nonomuraea pusilla]|uniref:Uncharacterized protein n=1 Tax=Nonomuraea pusilla TaxID=46177 RepID=A0A1H8K1I5_9ACTN|nr:hypothetical protein [Nonomuraea pusilla]SEN86665.1 hypothetical protein SAMN05660976_08494 [Nonomuraea pusilla]
MRPKIRVRSKITGDIAEIAPEALKHFPDFEQVDAHAVEPAPAAEPQKTSSRSTAAKTTDKE